MVSRRTEVPRHGATEHLGGSDTEGIEDLCDALAQNPAGVVVTCSEGNIVFVNDALTKMTGYASDELVGRHASVIGGLPPEEQKRLAETLGGGGTWQGEVVCTRKSGERFLVSSSMSAVSDSDRGVAYFLGLHVDITGLERGASISSARRPDTSETALSDREIEVLRLLALGRTNREIADRLGISKRTADHHVSSILQKLGAANRAAAVLAGARAGLIALEESAGWQG